MLLLQVVLEGFLRPHLIDEVLLPVEELEDRVAFGLDHVLHLRLLLHLGGVPVPLRALLLLAELRLVQEDVRVELLGVFLPDVEQSLLLLLHLLLQGHPFVLDRSQRAVALNLLPDRDSELPLVVLEVAFQLRFVHDCAELLLRLAVPAL